jgi:LacI family transcriptional regulator
MKRIALVMGLSDFYEHGIARGVISYAKSRPDWRIFGRGWMFGGLGELEGWQGDGVIARVEDAAEADSLSALGLPVVDVAGAYSRPGFRSVTNDDFLTGYRAARYFAGLGFESLAFLGVEDVAWSAARRAGAARALGVGADDLPAFERSLPWWEDGSADESALAGFLASLPRPAAVFACNDTAGLRAVEVSARLGIAVPAELAVLGVDDEDIVCELASPSLSSVALDCQTIGRRAAELLDAVLEGSGPPEGTKIDVPPREVAERESTLTYAFADPLVAKAAAAIRAHAHEGLDVTALLRLVPASRRSLETRYLRVTGRTLHEDIVLARLARAKRLLLGSDLGMGSVASASGFGSLQRFHETFRRIEGSSPGAWREAVRREGK